MSEPGTYRDELTAAMDMLAANPETRFIGYGIRYGKAMGTLKNVRERQLVETTVTESLMVSMAIGMSLRGLLPVVFIERFDFILNAADAIVNHLDKLNSISRGEFNPAVIIRVVVGNKEKPLFTGATHTQDFSDAFYDLVKFPVVRLINPWMVREYYDTAYRTATLPDKSLRTSTLLVEFKDLL